ncbi:hypothetical protein C1645_780964, partial [Glomus cerebriforme]
MEDQKMSWHDDGERGVGPVVASLSMGSPAEMKFRVKTGTKRKLTNQEISVANKKVKKEEKGKKVELPGTSNMSKDVYIKKRTTGPDLVLELHHGDLIIMVGEGVQKNYEHMVVPKGFRIASTTRFIS